MKNFIYLLALVIVILNSSVNAQWVHTNGPSGYVYSLAASDTNLFAGNNNGKIFRSTDTGTSWTIVYNGTAGTRTDAFAVSDTNIFAANGAGVLRSTDNGTNWTVAGLTNVDPQALAISDTNLFAGTYISGVFRSTNNGTSWSAVNSGLTGSALYITALFVSDTNLFAGTWGSSAFRSTNNGTLWTSANNGLTSNNVHAFTVSTTMGGSKNLFAGTYYASGVYLSTDNGESWTAVVDTGLTNSNVRALAISDTNLFAGTDGGGVFLSANNGLSWTTVNEGLTNNVVNALIIYDTYLFAGTGDGVWRLPLSEIIPVELTSFTANTIGNNINLNWQTATETNNQGFEIYRNGNKIAFVDGKGTTTEKQDYSFVDKNLQSGIYNYRLNQIDFDGTQEVVGELTVNLTLPEQFALEQNYPNPFNPSTSIRYSIPTSKFVTLKIYDVLGNEVATLVNEEKPAGSYEINFEASQLSSGIYFYKLQAGNPSTSSGQDFVETKKMLLLK